jgi:transposase-like protein
MLSQGLDQQCWTNTIKGTAARTAAAIVLKSATTVKLNLNSLETDKGNPSVLERGNRSEPSVNLALAEMYVQGVSTC